MASFKSDRRLWLTADKARVVEDGDPEAAFLLAGPEGTISPDDVERLGLKYKDGRVVLPDAKPAKKKKAKSEDKQKSPAGNKSKSKAKSKSKSKGKK